MKLHHHLLLLFVTTATLQAAGDVETNKGPQHKNLIEVTAEQAATRYFEMLKSDDEIKKGHVASFTEDFEKIAFKELQRLDRRFTRTRSQKLVATKRMGDFSLSMVAFNGERNHPGSTTALLLVRHQGKWRYMDEKNIEALAKDGKKVFLSVFNEQQSEGLKGLFEWWETIE